MCGIAGILGLPREIAEAIAPRMAAAIAHRGPDDRGVEYVTHPSSPHPVVLLHARLAILDISPAGHQPMRDSPPDGGPSNWITYNGEIFNYRDCHADLAAAGRACRTRCDTEVILNAYAAWGEGCVERFRGMFAWCLVDARRGMAWFCRDRLGIKPLYLYRPPGGGLLFASELRALLAAGPEVVRPVISTSALESFLAQGAVIGEDSIVRGVRMLGAGESLLTDLTGREVKRRRYWFIPPVSADPPGRAEAVARLSSELRGAVALRLISDVPLGLFLSGGIDSASLAAIATEVSGTRLKTVSVGYDDPAFDESAEAEAIARKLGTEHVELQLTGQQMLEDLPDALSAMDQPTVDGFNVYFVSRAARRAGLTVALSGLGGDELFGGYASFRDVPRAAWAQRWLGRIPGLTALTGALGKGNRRSAVKAAQVLRRARSLAQLYLLRRELFLTPHRHRLLSRSTENDPESGIPLDTLRELAACEPAGDAIDVISRLELTCYMRHMLLRDADAFSMVHALELRVPLLDHRVVEVVASFPGRWKRPDPRPKPLLVDAVGNRLPRATYESKKRGFALPWATWLRGPMRERARSAAGNAGLWASIGMDSSEILGLWQRFDAGDRRVAALQVLAMVVLEHYVTRHGLRGEA